LNFGCSVIANPPNTFSRSGFVTSNWYVNKIYGKDDQLLGPQIWMTRQQLIFFSCHPCRFRHCQKQSFRFMALSRLIDWTWQGQLDNGLVGPAWRRADYPAHHRHRSVFKPPLVYVALFLYLLSLPGSSSAILLARKTSPVQRHPLTVCNPVCGQPLSYA
jgi:hypothetical protein